MAACSDLGRDPSLGVRRASSARGADPAAGPGGPARGAHRAGSLARPRAPGAAARGAVERMKKVVKDLSRDLSG